MVEAKQASDWDHTAILEAKLHNVNCVKDSDKINPAERNPFRKHQVPTVKFSEIKQRREEARNG